jgi:ribokinase
MRVAVVGHMEWCEFAKVAHVPTPGEIIHAERAFREPGGGGAVAAVQLKKLAGSATLFTAFGDDEVGHRSRDRLVELGVDIEGGFRPEPQRRAFVHVDDPGERTITVLGPRLGPRGADDVDWDRLDDTDAVYLTAGDVEAVRHARRARILVATPRGLDTLSEAHVELDALVSSGRDPGEIYREGDLDPVPRVVVRTLGATGGEWETASGERGRWDAASLPGPVRDAYGAGDSFAAGLTYGLGAGWEIEKAVELAARCGAACMTGHGPYEGQLTL